MANLVDADVDVFIGNYPGAHSSQDTDHESDARHDLRGRLNMEILFGLRVEK